jgi:hypothetical protein
LNNSELSAKRNEKKRIDNMPKRMLFEEELARQVEEEQKQLEEEKWRLEKEKRKRLEEAEKAYEIQLQEKGKRGSGRLLL